MPKAKGKSAPNSKAAAPNKEGAKKDELVAKLKKQEAELVGLRATSFDTLLKDGDMEALKAASKQKDEELKALRPQAPKKEEAAKEPAGKGSAPDGGYPAKAAAKAKVEPKKEEPAVPKVDIKGLRLKVISEVEDEDDNDKQVEDTLEMLFTFDKGNKVKVKFEYTNDPHNDLDYEETFETTYSTIKADTGELRVELQYNKEAKNQMVADAVKSLSMVSKDGNLKGPWKILHGNSDWLPYNDDNRHDNSHDLTEAEVETQ